MCVKVGHSVYEKFCCYFLFAKCEGILRDGHEFKAFKNRVIGSRSGSHATRIRKRIWGGGGDYIARNFLLFILTISY